MTHRFTITITLAEPTALTEGSSDAGGGHTTLPYIPGTSILGALVGTLGIEPNTPLFASAFLSGSTRFLNAYPGSGSTRTLPRPLTYKVGKLSKSRAYDAIAEDGCDIPLETIRAHFAGAEPSDTLKSTRLAMIDPHEPGVDRTPERIEQVHVGLDRGTRAAADGVLFTYEAVRGGSVFIGAIETEDAEVAAILRSHATCELRLGRSRGAGYGRALAAIAPADGGSEYERMQRPAPGGQPATVPTIHASRVRADRRDPQRTGDRSRRVDRLHPGPGGSAPQGPRIPRHLGPSTAGAHGACQGLDLRDRRGHRRGEARRRALARDRCPHQ